MPLSAFRRATAGGEGKGWEVPIWTYKGHVIWGLTARILRWNFKDRGEAHRPYGAR